MLHSSRDGQVTNRQLTNGTKLILMIRQQSQSLYTLIHLPKKVQQQLIDPSSACQQLAAIQQDNRRPIIGGGISVLRAVFALLDIDTLHVVRGALRQGVLHQLLNQTAAG